MNIARFSLVCLLVASSVGLLAAPALSASLGEPESPVYAGRPFNMRIPLLSDAPIVDIKASGIDRVVCEDLLLGGCEDLSLRRFHFKVVSDAGSKYVEINSKASIDEAYLKFGVRVADGFGSVVRIFTILPEFDDALPASQDQSALAKATSALILDAPAIKPVVKKKRAAKKATPSWKRTADAMEMRLSLAAIDIMALQKLVKENESVLLMMDSHFTGIDLDVTKLWKVIDGLIIADKKAESSISSLRTRYDDEISLVMWHLWVLEGLMLFMVAAIVVLWRRTVRS